MARTQGSIRKPSLRLQSTSARQSHRTTAVGPPSDELGSPHHVLSPSRSHLSGFIVCNNLTYPNFLWFLKLLKIPLVDSDMSFAVTRDRGAFEWAGGSPAQLFAQRSNLLKPGHWRMLWDIIRFNSGSLKLLRQGDTGESIGDYLKRNGYSDSFRDNYLLVSTTILGHGLPSAGSRRGLTCYSSYYSL